MSENQPVKRRGKPTNPRWEHIPVGSRLTMGETARILAIGRETLRKNYIGDKPRRRLPAGFHTLRDGLTVLIVRTS